MYKVTKYPDKSGYVTTDKTETETVRMNSYRDLWEVVQLVDAKHSLGVRPKIVIPCLLDAQADRRFEPNQSSGLKLVLECLRSLPADFLIFHPHNPEVIEALMPNATVVNNQYFIKEVLNIVPTDKKNLVLMSSDAGGYKPLMKLCQDIDWRGETYSASKSRKFEGGKTTITQLINVEDFEGRDIMIIDDICVNGGTFIGLGKLLRERNVGKLYLTVSHMTLENLNQDLFVWFDKIYTTNSKYDNYYLPSISNDGGYQPKALEVIKRFKPTQYV